MLKDISIWVLLALICVGISLFVVVFGAPTYAAYLVVVAIFAMQVAAREE